MPNKRIGQADDSDQVDDDKKANRGEPCRRMDDMPIDWIEQVISFLPLTDVYKCRSVCKAWNVAADRALSDWETLVMGNEPSLKTDKNQIFMNDADCETWIKRLGQLVRLKRIFVTDGYYFWSKLWPVVNDVVLRNAATLTLLHMEWEPLPFDPDRPVVFHNLRDLECLRLDPDQAAACPRLVKLRTSASLKVLQKLPAEKLTCLRIDELGNNETGSHEKEIKQLIAVFSRFTRLKSLIQIWRHIPDEGSELYDVAFRKLFTNMKELEEVEITFPEQSIVFMDEAIETLVRNNPSLKLIRMMMARMADKSLRSLSRLTGLQHLTIRSSRWQSDITTEGILSLLRGGSRNVLRDLEFNIPNLPDLDQIRAEGQLIQQETGRSFSVDGSDSPDDPYHNCRITIRDGLKRLFDQDPIRLTQKKSFWKFF